MIDPGSEATMPVFPSTASLATQMRNQQERPGAARQACGASRRESEEFHTGFGDPDRAVAYCRPVGTVLAQRRPDAGRCAKHDRAGPHATLLDPTAFP